MVGGLRVMRPKRFMLGRNANLLVRLRLKRLESQTFPLFIAISVNLMLSSTP